LIRSIIAAISENNGIGRDNDLLWHLPSDMKFFRKTTLRHCVITGRKNYESIPEKYRPLANRTNIVVTRNANYKAEGAVVKNSLEEALEFAKSENESEVFIIGGGQIYKEAMGKNVIDKMYITHVAKSCDADTFFPEIELSNWNIKGRFALESESFAAEVRVYEKK
jgi:dihydrofolate reductase|tara:strand:+ start:5996 stop:6493 length:498 start_codon:yes stop_codon:yes gene_type:complete